MIYLAEHEGGELSMVSSVAEQYGIPRQFLAKLVQTLSRNHLIKSYRGRKGGIELGRPADQIRVLEIVNVIDGPPPEHEMCIIGLDVCDDNATCPLHFEWTHIKNLIRDTLEHQTLAELAEGMRNKRRELAESIQETEDT
jgi:Rrf2 family protein